MRYLLLCLLGLPVLVHAQQPRPDTVATRLQLPGADCVLFSEVLAFDTLGLHAASTAPYRFTPTRQQVKGVEGQLRARGVRVAGAPINRYDAANIARIQKRLRYYKRQYFGFYNAHQQPCLFIQLLDIDRMGMDDGDWLYGQQLILDGGTAVCQICYNLATQKFFGLGYHGSG